MRSVPPSIAAALREGRDNLELEGSVIVADLEGFTAAAAALETAGPQGAERLRSAIERAFAPIVASLEAGGAEILQFAGDALGAYLPEGEAEAQTLAARARAAYAAAAVALAPEERRAVRIGFAAGPARCRIVRAGGGAAWLVEGEAWAGAFAAAQAARPIGGPSLLARTLAAAAQSGPARESAPLSAPEALDEAPFYPADRDPRQAGASFRGVASLFVAAAPGETPEAFGSELLDLAAESGGWLPFLDHGEKGLVGLLVYGYPRIPEDPYGAALKAALRLGDRPGRSRGLAYGRVYAGPVGARGRVAYTVIGSSVNLACRLMQAGAGELLTPAAQGAARAEALGAAGFALPAGEISCKGYPAPVAACRVAASGAPEGGAAAPPRREAPFVGRTAELAALRDPAARRLLLRGEAGSGKSRLVREALGRPLALAEPEGSYDLAYAPWKPLARAILEWGSRGPARRETLGDTTSLATAGGAPAEAAAALDALALRVEAEGLDPGWEPCRACVAALLGLEGEAEGFRQAAPEARAAFMARALAAPLAGLLREAEALREEEARPAPSVPAPYLLVEDLHRFRPEDLAVLDRLAAALEGAALRVVATTRGGAAPEGFAALDLAPLGAAEAADMAAGLGGPPLSPEEARRLPELSGGNAFFLEQLVLHRAEAAARPSNAADGRAAAGADLPDTLSDLVAARVDRLGAAATRVLSAAAVLGLRFRADHLERAVAAEGAPADCPGLLELARAEGLVDEEGRPRYLFRHALVRETLGASVLGPRARALHALALALLEEESRGDPAALPALVAHAEGAGDLAGLVRHLELALEWSGRGYRPSDALAWSSRLVGLAAAEPSLVRPELLRRAERAKAEALGQLGRVEEARAAWRDAAEAARAAGDRPAEALALAEAALWTVESLGQEGVAPLLDGADALLPLPPAVESRVREARAVFLYYEGRREESLEASRLQHASALASGDPVLVARACDSMAAAELAMERDKDAPLPWLAEAERALEGLAAAGRPDLRERATCEYYYTVALSRRSEHAAALARSTRHLALARALGDTTALAAALVKRGQILTMAERYDEAFAALEEARIEVGRGASLYESGLESALANACYFSGRTEEALGHAERAAALARAAGRRILLTVAVAAAGRILHETGRTAEAVARFREELEECRAVGDELGKALAYGYLGMILVDLRRWEGAERCLAWAASVARRHAVPCRLSRLHLERARLLWARSRAEGRPLGAGGSARALALVAAAEAEAAKVVEPIVLDIPWQARVLKARIEEEARPGALAALIAETDPASLRACDRCLYHYERGRAAAAAGRREEAAEAWAEASRASPREHARRRAFDAAVGA